jgi:hypothetical protein
MSIRDHLSLYVVTGIDYRERKALVTTFYTVWLERLPSDQRELMDIALAELVTHGPSVASIFAKPIQSATPRTEGPTMYELRHPDHRRYALRAFCLYLPAAPFDTPNVVVVNGNNKHGNPDFYRQHESPRV